jgi:hypothetical protein
MIIKETGCNSIKFTIEEAKNIFNECLTVQDDLLSRMDIMKDSAKKRSSIKKIEASKAECRAFLRELDVDPTQLIMLPETWTTRWKIWIDVQKKVQDGSS